MRLHCMQLMVRKLIGPVLLSLLIASAGFNLWASVRHYFTYREMYKYQEWVTYITKVRMAAQSLAHEASEYSRRNPAIDPILREFDLKPRLTNAPTAAAPSPKASR